MDGKTTRKDRNKVTKEAAKPNHRKSNQIPINMRIKLKIINRDNE
jgi:hypothetical protein